MRLLLGFLIVSTLAFAALGDNAPSIPSTYVTTHPRLGSPSSAYLTSIWTNRAGTSARYKTAADNWESTTAPAASTNYHDCRKLLIMYLAAKQAADATATSTYLAKIVDLPNITTWGSAFAGSLCEAMAYDWAYNDLDSTQRTAFRSDLYAWMTAFEGAYSGSSPYNDQFYITGSNQMLHLLVALAIYPDDSSTSLPHLRWSMDVWFNVLIPTWKHVIGGGNCAASTDSDTDCGGMWHESWGDYVIGTSGFGLTKWYIPSMLAWANASGRGTAFFTTDNGWIKNFAYWMMYQTRPDFTPERIGQMSFPYLQSEYTVSTTGAGLGSLEGIAAIYNDATIRGWARLLTWGTTTPDGFEPTAYPWYTADSSANSTNTRASLAKVKNFPGVGTLFFRSGWTENDTMCTLRYGDSMWSHIDQDTGSFTCYNRGALAIRSGNYRPGSNSPHYLQYAQQAIAHNTLLVKDTADVYATDTVSVYHDDGSIVSEALENDGGQRRVASGYNAGGVGGMQEQIQSPADPYQWTRSREYYQMGTLVAYSVATGNKYSYAAIDMTKAYNNLYSRNAYVSGTWRAKTASGSNRTFRVQKAVRHFVFIPRGTAAYVVTYDQVVSTSSSFAKKTVLHSINAPSVVGSAFTITRADLVTASPYNWTNAWASQISNCPSSDCSTGSQYQYAGKLYGWMTLPSGGTITSVGGVNNEFNVNGANYKECQQSQCDSSVGTGPTTDEISQVANAGPMEPGAYRLEFAPGSSNLSDRFMNVMLMTTTSDTNVVSTAPGTTTSGTNYVTVWKDNADTCTYTLTLPIDGVGGTLTATGAGCASTI